MYRELKRDILKALAKDQRVYELKGIKVNREECASLITLCGLYEREGFIDEPWKDKISSTSIAEVLVKYKMW